MSKDAKKDTRTKESGRPGSLANVLMPDIYAEEPVNKKIDIEFVDQSSQEADESSGFNPYDTASLFKK
jgi:hypothetical protein